MAEGASPSVSGQPIHATAVARHGPQGWRGVLLTGPSGAGKSDLALRLIADGWRLVADVYSLVWACDGGVWATAPERIAGLIEARGLGIVSTPTLGLTRLALVIACGREIPERAPQRETVEVAGVALPRLALDIRPASAAALVKLALDETLAGRWAGARAGATTGRAKDWPL